MKRESIVLKLSNNVILWVYFSENEAMTDNCDCSIGYELYEENGEEIDGGEMDYNAEEKGYQTIEDVLEDIMDFIFEDDKKRHEITYEDTKIDDIDDYFYE